MIKFKFTQRDTDDYNKWICFCHRQNKGIGFNLVYKSNGYFDPRPQINTNLTSLLALSLPFVSSWLIPISLVLCFFSWGSLCIHLPYDTGRGNDSESNSYGLTFYHVDSGFPDKFWVRGYNKLSFSFPWSWKYDKKEVLFSYGWRKEEKGEDFWDKPKWKNELWVGEYNYEYTLKSREVQKTKATVTQEKRYLKRWFGLITRCTHYLEVSFLEEIGEGRGTWKGGVVDCSYEFQEGETALQCLRRMEKERRFNR